MSDLKLVELEGIVMHRERWRQTKLERERTRDIKRTNLICPHERECPSGENANHMSLSLFHLFECSLHLIFKLKGPYRCPHQALHCPLMQSEESEVSAKWNAKWHFASGVHDSVVTEISGVWQLVVTLIIVHLLPSILLIRTAVALKSEVDSGSRMALVVKNLLSFSD